MTTEIWTPLKLINWTRNFFQTKGIEEPRLEAELLLARALGWKRIDLYTRFEEPVPPEKLAIFRDFVRRRAAREPAQYILGQTDFCGLVFKTDKRALVPRPETEIIVELAAKAAATIDAPLLVDIGTGSGVLAVSAAVKVPKARVVACDVSADALTLARENAERHKVSDRIEFRHGDFADALSSLAGQVHVAMANPPYVSEKEFVKLAPEVRDHEPRQALVAGPSGTEVETRVVQFAPTLLAPGGELLMEIGASQSEAVRTLVAKVDALELVGFERDFAQIERVAVVRKKQ